MSDESNERPGASPTRAKASGINVAQLAARLDKLEENRRRFRNLYAAGSGTEYFQQSELPVCREIKLAGYHVLSFLAAPFSSENGLEYASYHLERASYDVLELSLHDLLMRFRLLVCKKFGHSHLIAEKIGRDKYDGWRQSFIESLKYVISLDNVKKGIGADRKVYFDGLPHHLEQLHQYIYEVEQAMKN